MAAIPAVCDGRVALLPLSLCGRGGTDMNRLVVAGRVPPLTDDSAAAMTVR